MYCTKCGKLNQPSDVNCTACGQPLQNVPGTAPAQSVSNYLVFAILTTIFCCLPFGIVAIIFAAQANSKLKAGDYQGAVNASRKAKIWTWVSFGVGILVFLIGIIAAIVIPQFVTYHERANAAKTHAVLQQACAAKELFFTNSPDKEITLNDLMAGQMTVPPDLELTIEDGTNDNFTLVAVNKSSGKTYVMKSDCNTEELPVAK